MHSAALHTSHLYHYRFCSIQLNLGYSESKFLNVSPPKINCIHVSFVGLLPQGMRRNRFGFWHTSNFALCYQEPLCSLWQLMHLRIHNSLEQRNLEFSRFFFWNERIPLLNFSLSWSRFYFRLYDISCSLPFPCTQRMHDRGKEILPSLVTPPHFTRSMKYLSFRSSFNTEQLFGVKGEVIP